MKSIVVLLTFTLASCASLPPKRSSRRAAPPQNATRAPLARVAAACRRKPAAWWARLALWCAVARDPGAAATVAVLQALLAEDPAAAFARADIDSSGFDDSAYFDDSRGVVADSTAVA